MGVFAYIKNGVKYKMNQFPGAYPASRVSYNGSDVETALDELNADIGAHTFGTTVDLSTYTATPYVCPSDGYVYVAVSANNKASIGVNGVFSISALSSNNALTSNAMFVRKGMSLLVSGTGDKIFIPLE